MDSTSPSPAMAEAPLTGPRAPTPEVARSRCLPATMMLYSPLVLEKAALEYFVRVMKKSHLEDDRMDCLLRPHAPWKVGRDDDKDENESGEKSLYLALNVILVALLLLEL